MRFGSWQIPCTNRYQNQQPPLTSKVSFRTLHQCPVVCFLNSTVLMVEHMSCSTFRMQSTRQEATCSARFHHAVMQLSCKPVQQQQGPTPGTALATPLSPSNHSAFSCQPARHTCHPSLLSGAALASWRRFVRRLTTPSWLNLPSTARLVSPVSRCRAADSAGARGWALPPRERRHMGMHSACRRRRTCHVGPEWCVNMHYMMIQTQADQ